MDAVGGEAESADLSTLPDGSGLPEHPVCLTETEMALPPITKEQVTRFLNSQHYFLLAAADYRRRRAELVYMLQMLCEYEDQSQRADYILRLEEDGDTLRIVDQTTVPAETIVDRNLR